MSPAQHYRPRLPAAAPTREDLAERDRFDALVTASLPAVRSSAETWRNGLAAFITLVTTGVMIKGRDTTADMTTGWRVAITVLVATGVLAAVGGLWCALVAQAGGRPRTVTLRGLHSRHGSVRAYEVVTARKAAAWLQFARYFVGAAILALLTGITLTWWAPKAPARPPAYIQVTEGTRTTCGELSSGDGGQLEIRVRNRSRPVTIPLSKAADVEVIASCPS